MKTLKTGLIKTINFNLLTILFGTIVLSACSKKDDIPAITNKLPIVLVHGALQGDYVWKDTKAGLEAAGYQVTVVSLQGHSSDETPATSITLKTYVDQVKAAVNKYPGQVILVGHSLGGGIITQAAAEMPSKIGKLVYVAGFIPASGKSVLDYSEEDPATLLKGKLVPNSIGEVELLDWQANIPTIFCQDGTDAQKHLLLDHYRPEPAAPVVTPLNYSKADYQAAGNKYYIYTLADNAISYNFQQQMATAAGITNFYRIDSGHSPFISKAMEFTSLLQDIVLK